MRPHQKSLLGALISLGMATAAIVAVAEKPELLPRAELSFQKPHELFVCDHPFHHDGDAIRCGPKGRSDRLYAIDAPEMPGACRPGRQCTPGDPFAARDYLRALTAGKSVWCRQVDSDRYGRRILQCFADDIDLSCRMVRDGFAVERYGRLRC